MRSGEIWDDIEQKSSRFKVKSPTSPMNDIYNTYDDIISKYDEQFNAVDKQVGFIAVIGGKIAGADLFGRRSILKKIYNKVIKVIFSMPWTIRCFYADKIQNARF
ncbi:MAG: hypothetical protein HQK96_20575 [Nitrospirae bacterium]|nr:hypothetical protein [Nitrospirota bacterium]